MITTAPDSAIAAYMDALAEHLADLPEAERDELMEDLAQHLQEVAAEADGDLAEKLGTPQAYAEELRASAGIPPRAEAPTGRWARLQATAPLRALRALTASSTMRSLRAFLPELRPGWWVLRGYLIVGGLALYPFASISSENFPVPSVSGSRLVGAIAVALSIWASIRLGRAPRHGATRWLGIAATVLAVGLAWDAVANFGYRGTQIQYVADPGPSYLHHGDGAAIANFCPYGADGKLLSGVLLFDQDGRAIVDTAPMTREGYEIRRGQPSIPNAYPQDLSVPTFDGSYRWPPDAVEPNPEAPAADQIRPLRCAPSVHTPTKPQPPAADPSP